MGEARRELPWISQFSLLGYIDEAFVRWLLVSANIRHALGSTEVNNEIKNTALKMPDKFWYFNNGITLVAEEALKAPAGAASRSAGTFSFAGSSVVNGAQTISSLARVDNDSSLGIVRVPIRVVVLKNAPYGFGEEVTRTNNFQNKIEPRDFVAQDPEQKRIREEMAVEGIEYLFVRSEDASPTSTSCELMEVTTALACASSDPSLAVQLKTGIGRFFSDLTKHPYRSIFNPSVSGAKAYNAVLVQRIIDAWIERRKREIPKKSGPEWGMLVHGNRILSAGVFTRLGEAELVQPISAISVSDLTPKVEEICATVCERSVEIIKKKFQGKFLAVLFKNPGMSKQVFDASTSINTA